MQSGGVDRASPARDVGESVDEDKSNTGTSSHTVNVLSFHQGWTSNGTGMSRSGTMSNFVLSIIGTTVLGVANVMAKGGWFLPIICTFVGTTIIFETTRLVSESVDKLVADGAEVKVYADFAGAALGPVGRRIASVSSSLSTLGMICGSMVVMTKSLQYATPLGWKWPIPLLGESCMTVADRTTANGMAWYSFFLSFTTLFYTLVPLDHLLHKTATAGPVVCFLCICLAWWGAGNAISDLDDFPIACRDTAEKSYWSAGPPSVSEHWPGYLWDCISITFDLASYNVYSFAVVVTTPSLKMQMTDPRQFVRAAGVAYAICAAVFVSIMILCYWGYGHNTPESIIDAMQHDRPADWFAMEKPWQQGTGTFAGKCFAWLVIANLVLTDGIYVPVAAMSLETLFPASLTRIPHFSKFVGVFLTLFRLMVSTSITSFISLNKLTSSLFCVSNNILIPVLAFYATKPRLVSATTKSMHFLVFMFGVGILSIGTYKSLLDYTHGGECVSENSNYTLRTNLTDACLKLLHADRQ